MLRPFFASLFVFAVVIFSCTESTYDQLASYKNAVTPADAELQDCLDVYAGRRLRIGEGYGYRLPFDSEETRRLLKRVEASAGILEGIDPSEAAEGYADGKKEAAGKIIDAFKVLDDVTRSWDHRLPAGIPPGNEIGVIELPPGEAERWRADMVRVDETFERARAAFNDAALALGIAILRARDEKI